MSERGKYILNGRVIQVGGYIDSRNRNNPNNGRVYSHKGIAPCLRSAMGCGGNQVPVIYRIYETT